jgi:hypothetical protein
MRRTCAAAAVLLVGGAASTHTGARAAEPAQTVLLRSTAVPLDSRVPLTADVPAAPDVLPAGSRLSGRQVVTVVVDDAGTPRRIRVRQRLLLEGTGDYSFTVPAPLLDVVAAPGSATVPGQRAGGIVWQGFLSERRVLAADATLRLGAARALPIRLSLTTTVDGSPLAPGERRSGHVRVRLVVRNVTGIAVQGFDAPAAPAQVAPALDQIAAAAVAGGVLPDRYLTVAGAPRPRTFEVDAPLAVSGRLRLSASALTNVAVRGGTPARDGATAVSVRFRTVLTTKRPAVISLDADGSAVGSPSLVLTCRPTRVVPALAAPGGRSWRDAAESGRAPGGRELVGLASRAVLQLARVQQFDELLSVPGPGASSTEYRFRTSASLEAGTPRAPSGDDGSGVARAFAWLLGAAALACAGVVVWTRL